jgi:catechol 2,3-dioxygenase-like lactoylglutathione lyase family enzyme
MSHVEPKELRPIMLSHIHLGVADFGRAVAFYAPIMAALGLKQRFADPVKGWAAWNPSTGGRPLFIIGKPYNGAEHDAGNGQMVAFMANTRAVVEQAHALALAHGGKDEGQPGLRPHYHANYYGAYFRDPDGNKVCVVCHDAASGAA